MARLIAGAAVFAFLAVGAAAQVEGDDPAPPPLKFVTKADLARLEAATDVKKRTQTALDLMSERLKTAESFGAQEQLDEMYKELGGFHGIMDNTLAFLDRSDQNRGKVLNNYKKFEMGLRQFRPRLELIRRDIPVRYEAYVRNLIVYLREARAKAVEPLFSDSVVPRTKP
ncbi:MAG TPA: hypothetical protein VMS29_01755 [Pyrinomonadaceae bacterium]|nr:hypothetical protein [Pyrinomonadaceae bacterium]